jgi:Ran GTPase-activating protein (RanGAP) involved in mRNA processing and transport
LNLSDNILADYGTTHLASMLRVNDGITDLNLCNNDIREKGIHELCSAIHDNNKLRTIRLVNNEMMGAEGTKALTALQKTLALTRKMRVYF